MQTNLINFQQHSSASEKMIRSLRISGICIFLLTLNLFWKIALYSTLTIYLPEVISVFLNYQPPKTFNLPTVSLFCMLKEVGYSFCLVLDSLPAIYA